MLNPIEKEITTAQEIDPEKTDVRHYPLEAIPAITKLLQAHKEINYIMPVMFQRGKHSNIDDNV